MTDLSLIPIVQPILETAAIDLSPIVQPILATAGVVITGLLSIYVPRALTAFQARTGIMLTDQQRATVLGAVKTAAGMLETDLDKGVLQVAHININNDAVRAQAVAAINAVPIAASDLGMTVDSVARMLVGAVDTASHGAVVAVPSGAQATTASVPLAATPVT